MPRPPRPRIKKQRSPARKTQPATAPTSSEKTPTEPTTARAKPQAEPDAGFIAVGRVLGPFGLKGEIKVQSLTDNPRRFAPRAKLWAGTQPVTVASAREASGHLYLTFKGYNDRSSTEKFRHAMLQVPEGDLPPLPEGEFYRFQLVGLEVVDRDGNPIGRLEEVIATGANDVYRVRTPDGADVLLPAIDDVIVSVDVAERRMVADPPEWR